MKASIAILTYNCPENIFLNLIQKIKNQDFEDNYEILIIDSSTENKLRQFISLFSQQDKNLRLIQIDNKDFNHGLTRDLAIKSARGEYVVFITQDAIPADNKWLQEIIYPFKINEKIVCVFGKQIPQKNANFLDKMWINNVFDKLSKPNQIIIHSKKNKSQSGLYFNSDTNSAYNKELFLKNFNFGKIDYAEDQIIAKIIIDSGFQKAYSAKAIVIHSHTWQEPIQYFLRNFDEARGLKKSIGYVDHNIKVRNIFIKIIKDYLIALKALWTRYSTNIINNIYWSIKSLFIIRFRILGLLIGYRYDEVPKKRWKYFSYEQFQKKIKFSNLHFFMKIKINFLIIITIIELIFNLLKAKYKLIIIYIDNFGLLLTLKMILKKKIKNIADQKQKYDFLKLYNIKGYKNNNLVSQLENNQNHISWIIPAFGKMSGGQTTIFRFAKYLEKKGFYQTFYIIPPYIFPDPSYVEKIVKKHYFEFQNVNFKYIHENQFDLNNFQNKNVIKDSKYLIMTEWRTAYYGYLITNVIKKIYFVQDLETMFYPAGAIKKFVENTYNMGYKYIAASKWLDQILKEKYQLSGGYISLGVDLDEYNITKKYEQRKQNSICVYIKQNSSRRGSILALQALKIAKQKFPDLKIYLFGDDKFDPNQDFQEIQAINWGILNSQELKSLYNKCKLGIVFSFTNYSIIPQEMNACALPVLEIDWQGNQINYKNRKAVVLQKPLPQDIAHTIIELFKEPKQKTLNMLSDYAQKDVEKLDWIDQYKKFLYLLNEE